MEVKSLSDAELEIMKIIWNARKPLLSAQISEALAGNMSGLIAQLVQSDTLTEAEYDQLKKILEEK